MVDTIIVLIVIVLLVFALKGSLKHFRGEGTCCGGSGTGKPARLKTLDGPVVGRRTIKISGMHCQNCVNSVTNALNAIDGVVAKVELQDNSAEVSYDRTVDEIELKNAVEKAGFKVINIS
ncbi:MAG TPA: heavy-metal-associated domain-containing protein [Candidatus Blautia intestinavium]|nr:heavy-metal-associated domain-containing protein [Candidatus Blautia intestinavium]